MPSIRNDTIERENARLGGYHWKSDEWLIIIDIDILVMFVDVNAINKTVNRIAGVCVFDTVQSSKPKQLLSTQWQPKYFWRWSFQIYAIQHHGFMAFIDFIFELSFASVIFSLSW